MEKKTETPIKVTWCSIKTGIETDEPPEWFAQKLADLFAGKTKKPYAI